MRTKTAIVSIALVLFAGFWTYLAISTLPTYSADTMGLHGLQTNAWIGDTAIASASWILAVGTILHLSRKDRRDWRRAGFDDSAIDILSEKRGASSRLRILEVLKDPNRRSQVSSVTGIDWREVDREVRLMKGLGLVYVQTLQGRGELYELTGRGKVALDLLERNSHAKNIEEGTAGTRPEQTS
jgi:DNA-binding transcriptional ArsR family regulator